MMENGNSNATLENDIASAARIIKVETNDTINTPQTIQPPNVLKLEKIARELHLSLGKDELKEYEGLLTEWSQLYGELEAQQDPDLLPVKYPRQPGYRPSPEENYNNAWYWKTDIHGESSGKLHGCKVALKDNIAVAGIPMMNGSCLMEGYIPEFDATVVTRILAAGGFIAGKAACEDMCLACNSFTNANGRMYNPYDKTRSAGGSTSGAAILVSTGEVDMAMGGDQGGSIRAPSACTGIVGLKPTFGLVPYTGIYPIEWRVDHTGPMARTVKDCALLLEAVAGYDNGLDARQPPNIAVPDYKSHLVGNLSGLKVGLLEEGFSFANQDIAEVVRTTATRLTNLGAKVREVSVPWHKNARFVGEPACYVGAYENMISSRGFPVGMKGFYATSMMSFMEDTLKSRINGVQPMVKASMLFGAYIRQEYGNRLYGKAVNIGQQMKLAYNQALEECHVLIMPTIPNIARKLPPTDVDLKGFYEAACADLVNTQPFDVTGHPAITVNAGFVQGLPVGLMLVGRHFDEKTLLRVAHGVEQVRDGGEHMALPSVS